MSNNGLQNFSFGNKKLIVNVNSDIRVVTDDIVKKGVLSNVKNFPKSIESSMKGSNPKTIHYVRSLSGKKIEPDSLYRLHFLANNKDTWMRIKSIINEKIAPTSFISFSYDEKNDQFALVCENTRNDCDIHIPYLLLFYLNQYVQYSVFDFPWEIYFFDKTITDTFKNTLMTQYFKDHLFEFHIANSKIYACYEDERLSNTVNSIIMLEVFEDDIYYDTMRIPILMKFFNEYKMIYPQLNCIFDEFKIQMELKFFDYIFLTVLLVFFGQKLFKRVYRLDSETVNLVRVYEKKIKEAVEKNCLNLLKISCVVRFSVINSTVVFIIEGGDQNLMEQVYILFAREINEITIALNKKTMMSWR